MMYMNSMMYMIYTFDLTTATESVEAVTATCLGHE